MDLESLVAAGRVADVRRVMGWIDDSRRKAVAAGLPALVRERNGGIWSHADAGALAVVVVGCAPSAARAAAILGRRMVLIGGWAAEPVVETARERGVDWLPDLAYRLVDRMTDTGPGSNFAFAARLLMLENAPPPTTDAFVEGWVHFRAGSMAGDPDDVMVGRLRSDPFLDTLLPRVFEVDGVGNAFRHTDDRTGRMPLPFALATLAAEGRLDRAALLDGCLGRLLRGGTTPALRPFVALHDLVAPAPEEVAARASYYVRLLADGPPPAATMAQRALRAAPGVDPGPVLDASPEVLTRPEKGLVRAQVAWLDRLAADHPAEDVRDRAATLVATHRRATEPAPVTVATPRGDDLPPPAAPLPVPSPITDPDELAEEVAALVGGHDDVPAAIPLDRVLDALVRFAATDPARAARSLAPVLERIDEFLVEHEWERGCLHGSLRLALGVLADPGPRLGKYAVLLDGLRPDRPAFPSRWPLLTLPAPQGVVLTRLVEIGARARSDPRPGLVAAPVWTNGALDAGVLIDRLAALGGRDPWPGDLAQALLRLPAVVDEGGATRAEALRTPAGDHLAAWLRRGGLPRPEYGVVPVGREWVPGGHLLVTAAPPDAGSDRFGLLRRRVADTGEFRDNAAGLWPAALPGYRGLVAAWVLPVVAASVEARWRGGSLLPALAECTGDGGPAVELALAYGLAAKREVDRVGAVDALLALVAAGQLDAAATGARLGELVRLGVLTWSRCLGPLRDAAAAGARLATWRMLAAALPTVLAMPKPPPGTPDLLTLAADTAAASGEAIAVPGLAEVAARRGSSRLVTEARRLAAAIG